MTWSRVKDLFGRALEIPHPERKVWLAHEAGDDDALIAEVQSLLDSHEHSGQFLHPVSAEQRFAALDAGGTQPGERVGAYRLVEMIGTGGMGDVYKAVRDDDQYKAEVAIKLMRADVRNPLAEQRFKTERQILAQLDHRNIARLLDGGTTPNGLPYVVMELVTGQPIDLYCDEKQLEVRARVQLFLQVCAAVSVAHQHLVVHRDLKPNNIFVTADGSVKLLDFGIAKMLEPVTVTGKTGEETRTQFRAMTLEYASPEQLSGGAVTTVSDVYSLGVVLYRLLTGLSPYRSTGGEAARVAEILGDTTPTRPSQATAHERRAIEADLDNILLMALRKEPAKRYGSVEQLANDLRNFLAGNPVLARRGNFAYRAGKFARRNKVSIAAGLIIVTSLAGGLAFSLREARIANEQRVIAQRHFDSVRKLANRLFEFHDEIAKLPGATKAREDLVMTSLEYLDALYKESGNDLALREELGTAYRKVGTIQNFDLDASLGDTPSALRSFERAIALLEPVVAAEPKNGRAAASLAQTYVQKTRTILRSQGPKAARESAHKAIALLESRPDAFADPYDRMSLRSTMYFTLAEIEGNLGDVEAGMQYTDKLVATVEDYHRTHPDERRAKIALEGAYNNAGIVVDTRLTKSAAIRRSVELLRRALAIDEGLLAAEPDDLARKISIAETHFNIGNSLAANDEFTEALAEYRLAEPGLLEAAADQKNARASWVVATNRLGIAASLARSGKPREALPVFASAESLLDRLRNDGTESLEVKFTKAILDIQRGGAFTQMAADLRNSESRQLEYWRKAREQSARGTEAARQINEIYTLIDSNKKLWEFGLANLAKADAAIAKGSR